MSPTLTTRRPSAERCRPEQLCDRRRTIDSSMAAFVFQTPGFTTVERHGTDPQRPPSHICRPGRWKDAAESGIGRIHSDTTTTTTTTTRCRQRRGCSAGAVNRVMSNALRLLLVVAVLSSETRASPLRAGLEHLRRPRGADHQRPLPFSVDTYDEAVVSHVFERNLFNCCSC